MWGLIAHLNLLAGLNKKLKTPEVASHLLNWKRLKLCTSSHPDSDKSCYSGWFHYQTSNQWNQYQSRLVTPGSQQKKMEILVLQSAAVLGCLWSALERTAGLSNFNSSQTLNSNFSQLSTNDRASLSVSVSAGWSLGASDRFRCSVCLMVFSSLWFLETHFITLEECHVTWWLVFIPSRWIYSRFPFFL